MTAHTLIMLRPSGLHSGTTWQTGLQSASLSVQMRRGPTCRHSDQHPDASAMSLSCSPSSKLWKACARDTPELTMTPSNAPMTRTSEAVIAR